MTTHLIPAIAWGRLEIACVNGRLADKGRNDPAWEWTRHDKDGYATVGEGPTCRRCVAVVKKMLEQNRRMLQRFTIEAGGES